MYSSTFFTNSAPGSARSAQAILQIVLGLLPAKSVIDFGCGQGAWLAASEVLGASTLVGVDGPWVDANKMANSKITFKKVDLESAFQTDLHFDLCISVEVAEHLSSQRAESFVQDLCASSDVVLFSAAIPQQGGVNHINEQWQSYWAGKFKAQGYECYDIIRPRIWDDSRIDCWYRQNILLYIAQASGIGKRLSLKPAEMPIDIVHPDLFLGNLENYKRAIDSPTLRFCMETCCSWGKRQLRRLNPVKAEGCKSNA